MTLETKIQLKKRFKSLLWRLGGMTAVVLLDFVATNIGLFNLPPSVVTVIGLVVGELTKLLNSKAK